LIRSKPGLCLAQAWQFFIIGQTDKATQWLDLLETQLGFSAGTKLKQIAVADLGNREIWERLATIRSTIYAWQGKAQPAIAFSQWALVKFPDGNQNFRCILEWNLAFASRLVGDVNTAEKAYLSAIEVGHAVGNTVTVLNATVGLAQLYSVEGQLEKAKRTFSRVFQLGKQYRMPYSVALGSAHIGLANIMCQRNKLEAANEHFTRGFKISEKWGVLDLVKAYVCQYRIKVAECNLSTAMEAIEKAIELAKDIDQEFRGGVARTYRTRLWLLQGELEKASQWTQNEFTHDAHDLSELNELGGITLARVLMAQGHLDDALVLLEQLFSNAQSVQRMGNAIEILILQAKVTQDNDQPDQASIYLSTAIEFAEPEGHLQVFINEGLSMVTLLTRLLAARQTDLAVALNSTSKLFVHKILNALQSQDQLETLPQSLVENLTPRELEVLQLIALGLSNREIGERLFLSVNTVKGYNREIFGKLGVQNRTEAANKARDLNIM
jgi:LuxR family maltose regulon positive regulatory protein